MSLFTDQLGITIQLEPAPQRIISLVPSQTELLFDLGLDKEVVGITKFCIHPNEWFRNKIRVGGTKTLNIEAIKQLQPDLIIANKEENVKEQIEALQAVAPVWTSDINNLYEALDMIVSVGQLTNRSKNAEKIICSIKEGFHQLPTINHQRKAAYLIWREPYMTVGGDTFISDLMNRCALENICSAETRYPEITLEKIREKGCELLLLSSEPYPFKEKHIAEIQDQMPDTKVLLVDGEMFSWYGSRLQYAPDYFIDLLKHI